MTALVSRVLVAAVLLPVVLLLIWAGGWWLVGLAVVAAMVALHELYVMTRDLRPVLLAGYAGTLATLIGAEVRVDSQLGTGSRFTLSLPIEPSASARNGGTARQDTASSNEGKRSPIGADSASPTGVDASVEAGGRP